MNTVEREESSRGHVSADECFVISATMPGERGRFTEISLILLVPQARHYERRDQRTGPC